MDKALAQSIGQAARAARISLHLTQEDAAERIGVSVEFYSRIERGAALPSLATFVRMSYILNVSSDVMIGRRGPEPDDDLAVATSLLSSSQEERPEVRRVLRRLRAASSGTLRFVAMLLKEIDHVKSTANHQDSDE